MLHLKTVTDFTKIHVLLAMHQYHVQPLLRKLIYSRTALIRTLFIRTVNYPDRLGPSVNLSRILQN